MTANNPPAHDWQPQAGSWLAPTDRCLNCGQTRWHVGRLIFYAFQDDQLKEPPCTAVAEDQAE